MNPHHGEKKESADGEIVNAVAVGALVGALILGIAGRLATALVAVATGYPANLSLAGIFQVAISGAIFGAVGGLFLLLSGRILPDRPALAGLSVGIVLFLLSLALTYFSRGMTLEMDGPLPLTLAVSALVFVAFAFIAQKISKVGADPREAESD